MDDVTTSVETGDFSHGSETPSTTTEAPQSSADLIGEYMKGQGQSEAPTPQESPEGQPQGEPTEPVETEATRAEKRIQEVLTQQAQMQQQMLAAQRENEQWRLMIMSNQAMRSEYERMQNGGQPQQAQQPQQVQVPEWDPFEPDKAQANVSQWALQAVQEQYGSTIERLLGLEQQLQAQIEQQQQAAHDQLAQTVDQVFYEALPSVKDNQAHHFIAEGLFKQAVQNGIQNGQQMTQEFFLQTARQAAEQAKQAIQGLGGPKPSITGAAPKVFTEGTGNLVSSVGEQPKDLNGLISAHINFNK